MPKVIHINLTDALKANPSVADIVAQQLNDWLDTPPDERDDVDWEVRMAEWEHDDV